MSKAYDKVQHTVLLNKLKNLGIRGKVQNWFKSYLENRRQIVEIDHFDEQTGEIRKILSDTVTTNWSIPQGSVLGCVLFLAYINDLPDSVDTLCVLFADDVSVLLKTRDNAESLKKVKETFHIIETWLSDHSLEINNAKTKLIQFRPFQKRPINLEEIVNSLNIQEVNECTLLGINIDTHLNWKSHVEKIKTKLSQFIYALSVIKQNTQNESALTAYYAYAYSWMRYGILLWGDSTDSEDIFIQQKKCIRIIYNLHPLTSCKPYFIKNKILTLPSIYILETASFVRKNIAKFEFCTRARHKDKLKLPAPKMELFKSSPYYRAITIIQRFT
ncbi:reverse transcriptase (RNA-dependent DNA polymerase) domain-containing protein [Phthorimaea operculella]|nr:reverse transcriptase (RNA-dependent DNA polymerase) domain-containing protein [Phthorimaea operculella]